MMLLQQNQNMGSGGMPPQNQPNTMFGQNYGQPPSNMGEHYSALVNQSMSQMNNGPGLAPQGSYINLAESVNTTQTADQIQQHLAQASGAKQGANYYTQQRDYMSRPPNQMMNNYMHQAPPTSQNYQDIANMSMASMAPTPLEQPPMQ